ncbi:type IX secretion system sortase PorU [Neolewinella antarctica]|uniref:Gingipain domain-containing protein n=1 Tax=Neolewinella antarctica TaxID=442734 RepID=A0ABX0XA65_9BACT|nr:type IX secretion system sortase PorU [Neolewinella antarctica]NJC25829.1 hypothetical protein [Neolewinella antarctica]
MRSLFTLLFFLFIVPLGAQIRVQVTFEWAPEPRIVSWEEARQLQYGFRTVARGGADAGAMEWDVAPSFLATFPAQPGRSYGVEILNASFEPMAAGNQGREDFPTELVFTTSASRQPEGYLGKVAGPAIINTPTGLQRLTALDLIITASGGNAQNRMTFATNSVLRQGNWYRIEVEREGVHKIDRAFLTDELGINLDGINPRNIALFGQSVSGKLPEITNNTPPDDLTEMAITIEGEADGSFDGNDFILFHALGPDSRTYDADQDRFGYEKNIYTNTNAYFLRVGGAVGRRVSDLPIGVTTADGVPTTTYDALYHFEEDKFNVLHELGGNAHGSGQTWYGDFFRVAREKNYPNLFRIPGLVTEEPARLRAVMGLRSDVSSRFELTVGDQRAQSSAAQRVNIGRQEQQNAVYEATINAGINLTDPNFSVRLNYPTPAGAGTSEGWLDYIDLRVRRRLQFGNLAQFSFRDALNRTASTVFYTFSDFPADGRVWRVDGADIRSAPVSDNQFGAVAGGRLFEFIAFRTGANLPGPVGGEKVDNQNLHATNSAELIIVTHPEFLVQATELAEHRRQHNGLRVSLVTTEQIYNEFSSGRDDVAAIRNYARMVYERDPELRYLLLFGDGSFDHRNILELGTTFIPTFQHDGRPTEVNSFPADDFYGIMGAASRAQPLEPDLNVAVGRLPVKTGDEAVAIVKKLIRYDTDPSTLGDWRTRMAFVGDDEDRGQHTEDVNRVANSVAARKPDLNFDKLYFDLFPQQSISAGDRYPDITEGLDRAVFRGALAVTYLGHGGPRGWAQERVLTIPQIRNWQRPENSSNPIQPPVFITATCTFSNYDDASFVSAGEEALLTPNGGASALLTTTRPVFATQNYALTNNTVLAMLERDDGKWRSLGDIIRIAKNEITRPSTSNSLSSNTENARKFTLLGDPAMTIAFPEHAVRTTMIDDQLISDERTDTVRALQQMKISGEVTDLAGNLLENFNGQVFPTIYDKPVTVTTLAQDDGSPPLDIQVQRNIVFRGRATVTNGKFSFEFVVPRDINYSFGAGKISYYAADKSQFTDAAGFYDKLVIGGTSEGNVGNDEGPTVEVFLDTEDFMTGGTVDEDPVLLVNLTDDLGINVTGNSIGHDLEAVLDEDTRNAIVLNDYYEADADDFRSGKVQYPLFDLEPGLHTVTVRAWDVANNSAIGKTEFIVAADGEDAITRILNYPNPFTDRTCFQFDHTLVGQEVEAIIQIYTVTGKLVKTLEDAFPFSDGTIRRDDCVEWDGLDDYGDQLARGVYLYQVRLRGDGINVVDGELEKLVILK